MPKGYQDSGSVPVAVPVGLPCYGHQPVDFSFRQILSGTNVRIDEVKTPILAKKLRKIKVEKRPRLCEANYLKMPVPT